MRMEYEPYVPEGLLEALQPGRWVRFRLGERGPHTCPKCGHVGHYDDPDSALRSLSGKTFQIIPNNHSVCSVCHEDTPPLQDRIALAWPHEKRGVYFTGFTAYPIECTPVDGPEVK